MSIKCFTDLMDKRSSSSLVAILNDAALFHYRFSHLILARSPRAKYVIKWTYWRALTCISELFFGIALHMILVSITSHSHKQQVDKQVIDRGNTSQKSLVNKRGLKQLRSLTQQKLLRWKTFESNDMLKLCDDWRPMLALHAWHVSNNF